MPCFHGLRALDDLVLKELVDLLDRLLGCRIRLQQVRIGSFAHAPLDIFLRIQIAEHDDLAGKRRCQFPDHTKRLESIHGRHHDIKKDHVRLEFRDFGDG